MENWGQVAGSLVEIGLTGLGTFFGGPMGAAAGGAVGAAVGQQVAAALGAEPNPAAVQAAIAQDPALAKERLAGLEAARQAEITLFQLQTADVQNARAMTVATTTEGRRTTEWTQMGLALIVTSCFIAAAVALFFVKVEIPDKLYSLLSIMFGALIGNQAQVLNFYFGTSRSSQANGDAMRDIARHANSNVANSNVPLATSLTNAVLGTVTRKAA